MTPLEEWKALGTDAAKFHRFEQLCEELAELRERLAEQKKKFRIVREVLAEEQEKVAKLREAVKDFREDVKPHEDRSEAIRSLTSEQRALLNVCGENYTAHIAHVEAADKLLAKLQEVLGG